MEIKNDRVSKTLLINADLCLERLDKFLNQGVEQKQGRAAELGVAVHDARAHHCAGHTYEEAAERLGNDEEAKELFELSIINDAYFQEVMEFQPRFEHETFLALDRGGIRTGATGIDRKTGGLVDGNGKEFFVCYLDRIGILDDGSILVEDMKTGREERDSEIERHACVAAAKAWAPQHTHFCFDYYYVRTGNRHRWEYIYESPTTVKIYGPGDENPTILADDINPLVAYLLRLEKAVRDADPIPTPGDHCENMYGDGCQFLGNGCSLEQQAEAYLNKPVPVKRVPTYRGIRKAAPEKGMWVAFWGIRRNLFPKPVPADIMGLAYQALQQVQGITKNVRKEILEWSKESGEFPVGEDVFAALPKSEVKITDKELAIKLLLVESSPETLARAVNISPSSLEMLGKRRQGLIDSVMDLCAEPTESAPMLKKVEKKKK